VPPSNIIHFQKNTFLISFLTQSLNDSEKQTELTTKIFSLKVRHKNQKIKRTYTTNHSLKLLILVQITEKSYSINYKIE